MIQTDKLKLKLKLIIIIKKRNLVKKRNKKKRWTKMSNMSTLYAFQKMRMISMTR